MVSISSLLFFSRRTRIVGGVGDARGAALRFERGARRLELGVAHVGELGHPELRHRIGGAQLGGLGEAGLEVGEGALLGLRDDDAGG